MPEHSNWIDRLVLTAVVAWPVFLFLYWIVYTFHITLTAR